MFKNYKKIHLMKRWYSHDNDILDTDYLLYTHIMVELENDFIFSNSTEFDW